MNMRIYIYTYIYIWGTVGTNPQKHVSLYTHSIRALITTVPPTRGRCSRFFHRPFLATMPQSLSLSLPFSLCRIFDKNCASYKGARFTIVFIDRFFATMPQSLSFSLSLTLHCFDEKCASYKGAMPTILFIDRSWLPCHSLYFSVSLTLQGF